METHPSVLTIPVATTNIKNFSTPIRKADENNLSQAWVRYKNTLINSYYFKYGLVLVKPNYMDCTKSTVKSHSFFLKDREFFFSVSKDKQNNNSVIPTPDTGAVKSAKFLLSKLTTFALSKKAAINPFDEMNIILFNKRHRDEILLPITFEAKEQNLGLYFYPWLSKKDRTFIPTGFTQYITAGCLFGSSLKGMDQHGANLELVKHDIKFFPDQKITIINYDPDASNPYEQMSFSEFEKLCHLINIFARPGQPKNLLFHLPYYDYVLFGVELFVRGRIEVDALDSFFKIIFAKREEYLRKINAICKEHDIEVHIESPFDNLFGPPPVKPEEITSFILKTLNLSLEEVSPNIELKLQQEKERNLVQYCLKLLQANDFNLEHQQVWKDFIQLDGAENITNLEQLFKIANASILGVGTKRGHDYEACSLLPLSEKQIQVSYSNNYSKKLQKKYPAVVNITTFEPLLTYSPTTQGLVFYFEHCQEALGELISNKKILCDSYKNVGLFANRISQKSKPMVEDATKITPITLDQVLTSPTSPMK